MVSARSIFRQILGSLVAVIVAWLVAILFLEIDGIVYFVKNRANLSPNVLWASPLAFSIYIFAFAIPVWLVALVPLYIFVPRSSVLWRWPVCTACGAIAGVAVVAFVFPLPGPNVSGEIWFPYTLGAFVGALTCFTGSMMRDRFKPPQTI